MPIDRDKAVESLRAAIVAADPSGATQLFSDQSQAFDAATVASVMAEVEHSAIVHQRKLGIPQSITAATLADVGRKIEAYGATVDRSWLVSLLRGTVLAFGRLQFERGAFPDGRPLHIPEGAALTPARVDESLALARQFLGSGRIICTSWLFDPALSALPRDSNIAAFVRRFDVGDVEPSLSGSQAAAKFVFRRSLAEVLDPAATRPGTRVEHVLAAHLRAGHHWSEPRAVLRSSGLC